VTVDEGVAGFATDQPDFDARRRRRRLAPLATAVVWFLGSAAVTAAQPGLDRKLSAAVSAAVGIATILVVSRVTTDPARRYLRCVIGTIVTVSVAAGWMLRALLVANVKFGAGGLVERIVLPLLVVLLAPVVASALPQALAAGPRELWARRAALRQAARPLDWIIAAYATVVAVPALLVGLAHHDRLLYVAQDLGLIVFFVFMYGAGRAVDARAAKTNAEELVGILLLLAGAQFVLFGWQPAPLYSYVEAACAGALGIALLKPDRARLVPLGLAVILLTADAAGMLNTKTQTSVAVELYGALGVLAYLALCLRLRVPRWLLVVVAVVGIVGFVGFTNDGATLRGQYHGADQSNLGRTYEAQQVRAVTLHSPVSVVFGRGLGSTIDESGASPVFKQALQSGGRDLAHVQEIHLLGYSFLLKTGFLGLAWLAVFAVGLLAVVVRALERAARMREPGLVVYVALPLLGVMQAQAATSHLSANPLIALSVGILVTCVGARSAPSTA
jgi:hypothetical protein